MRCVLRLGSHSFRKSMGGCVRIKVGGWMTASSDLEQTQILYGAHLGILFAVSSLFILLSAISYSCKWSSWRKWVHDLQAIDSILNIGHMRLGMTRFYRDRKTEWYHFPKLRTQSYSRKAKESITTVVAMQLFSLPILQDLNTATVVPSRKLGITRAAVMFDILKRGH